MKAIRVEKNEWLIRVIFDLADQKINKLSTSVMLELEQVLAELSNETSVQVVSFESAKKDIFIAGADIEELAQINTIAEAREKGAFGQNIFSAISELPQITVAIINGACVGGGCELALACDFRLLSDNPKTKIGLPEVKLGIIPGWGGTQRLPRLIGLPNALAIILAGKTLDAKRAYKQKLADKVVNGSLMQSETDLFLENLRDSDFRFYLKKRREVKGALPSFISSLLKTALGRSFVINQARKNVLKTTQGFYPAPLAAIEVMAQKADINDGLQIELEAFAKLAVSDISKNLIALFFLTESVKRDKGADFSGQVKTVTSAAVLGAGVMGGGIAWLMSSRGLAVRMKDISWDAIALGYAQAASYFAALKKRRRIKQAEIDRNMNRIGGSLEYQGFEAASLVVEAVVEEMKVKKMVLAEAESHLGESALLCTNTSALSVTEMASVLKRPQNFCGMHFFNPVNRMPLVEIIRTQQSSEQTIATAVATVKAWGKTPVVVSDCPGFLVNRILLPYMNEAAYLLEEGADIEMIDQTVRKFGMPMGPLELADQVGIDVGYKVAKILQDGFSERMLVCPLLTSIYEDLKLLGKKGGIGFYCYKDKKRVVNRTINSVLLDGKSTQYSAEQVIDRLMIKMVNEAARCLEEKVVANAGLLDLAMVMGTGFPPWAGGLCRWADSVGLDHIVQKCDRFYIEFGARYEVSPYLRELADSDRGFYDK